MLSVLRTVLIWVVVLALPSQGMAASTMLLCGPSHHRQQAAGAQHDHAAHQHGLQDAGGEPLLRHAPAPDATPAHEYGESTDLLKSAEHAASKCSACASCCSALALLGSPTGMVAVEPMAADYPSLSLPYRGFVNGGLERPPRSFLA